MRRSEATVAIAILVFLIAMLPTIREAPTDTAYYSGIAFSMHQGYSAYVSNDNSNPLLRPVVPFLLSLSYTVLDTGPINMFILVAITFVISLFFLYVIANYWGYQEWTGILAIAFIATSAPIYDIVFFHGYIDPILAMALLIAVLVIFRALRTGSYVWFGAAGVALALSFMTKEMAIILFPLPLLMVIIIPKYRTKRHLYGLLFSAAGLFMALLPWMIHSYTVSDGSFILGDVFEEQSSRVSTTLFPSLSNGPIIWFRDFISNLANGVHLYFVKYVSPRFPLAYVFLIAWIFTSIRAVRRNSIDVFSILTLLLFSPIMVEAAHENMGIRHLMVIWLLSYLATARLIVFSSSFVMHSLSRFTRLPQGKRKIAKDALVAGLAGVLIVIQLSQPAALSNVRHGLLVSGLMGEMEFTMKGSFNSSIRQKADLMDKHIPAGSTVLIDPYRNNALFVYTKGQYDFHLIRSVRSDQVVQDANIQKPSDPSNYLSEFYWPGNPRNYYPEVTPGRPLFIWTGQFPRNAAVPPITAMRQADLLRQIKANGVDYVVTNRKLFFLSEYLEASPSFREIYRNSRERFSIYEVLNAEPYPEFERQVSLYVSQYLKKLQNSNGERFQELKQIYFEYALNLSDEAFQELLSNN